MTFALSDAEVTGKHGGFPEFTEMYSSMCNKTQPDPGEEHLLVKYNLTFQSEHVKILTHQFREQDLLKHTSKLKVKAGLLHNV